jgi:hypothetical protein
MAECPLSSATCKADFPRLIAKNIARSEKQKNKLAIEWGLTMPREERAFWMASLVGWGERRLSEGGEDGARSGGGGDVPGEPSSSTQREKECDRGPLATHMVFFWHYPLVPFFTVPRLHCDRRHSGTLHDKRVAAALASLILRPIVGAELARIGWKHTYLAPALALLCD